MRPVKRPAMPFRLFLVCALVSASSILPALAQERSAANTVLVSGSQPGPPLWKVTRGEHALWILPLGSLVPQDMEWNNDDVSAVIADAQEVIREPDISVGVSKSLALNPFNIVRGIDLYRRLRRNPGNASLAEVLPEEIYRRYAALKARYFPRNDDIETLRPLFAAEVIRKEVPPQERLANFQIITRKVNDLIGTDSDIRVTDVKVELTLDGSVEELSERLDDVMSSLTLEREIECFESQLTRFESGLDDTKRLANAWATGDIHEIDDFAQPGGIEQNCSSWFLTSPEGGLALGTLEESLQRWFDAAVSALERNRTTFAMLPVSYITGSMSLVDRLAELGYEVHAPL